MAVLKVREGIRKDTQGHGCMVSVIRALFAEAILGVDTEPLIPLLCGREQGKLVQAMQEEGVRINAWGRLGRLKEN